VSDLVLDASLALQWFLEDEADRKYSLGVLSSLSEKQAVVPVLWFYEVGNGLLMAYRRKRIVKDQVDGFLTRLKNLPIEAAPQAPAEVLDLPTIAQTHSLTNYDAAYLSLALRLRLPLAPPMPLSAGPPPQKPCKFSSLFV
jgi:predicted nucleic acid-binding protein